MGTFLFEYVPIRILDNPFNQAPRQSDTHLDAFVIWKCVECAFNYSGNMKGDAVSCIRGS
jgi:hypothetical protein